MGINSLASKCLNGVIRFVMRWPLVLDAVAKNALKVMLKVMEEDSFFVFMEEDSFFMFMEVDTFSIFLEETSFFMFMELDSFFMFMEVDSFFT